MTTRVGRHHLPCHLGRRRLLGAVSASALAPLAACGLFEDDIKPITPGHRIDILPPAYGLEVDPTLALTPVVLPAPDANDDWPQPGRIPTHIKGSVAWSGGDKAAWQARIGTGQGYRSQLTAPPLVADGQVYTMDADAVIEAFDLATGHTVWRLATRPKKQKSTNVGGGITYADGTIYAATGLAEALAIDAGNGHVRWRVGTTVPVRSLPTVAAGKLFFGTIDQKLRALDASDGHALWNYQASQSFNAVLGQPAPAVSGNVIVAGFGSGEVAALGVLDGALVWSDTLGSTVGASPLEFASVHAEPIIDGDTTYTISVGGLLTATDMRTGRRIWETAIAGSHTPVLAGDWLFLLTEDDTVTCVSKATGHVRWNSVLPRYHKPNAEKQPIGWSGPLLAGNHLVFTSTYGQMLLLSPSEGTIEDQRQLRSPASQAPIAANGALLVLTDDGRLTAFR